MNSNDDKSIHLIFLQSISLSAALCTRETFFSQSQKKGLVRLYMSEKQSSKKLKYFLYNDYI